MTDRAYTPNFPLRIKSVRKGGFYGANIVAILMNGQALVLKHTFTSRDDARLGAQMDKIRAAGTINADFWREARKGEY